MHFIRIAKWEEYQHYKDRDPTWVKLHLKTLKSRMWVRGDDTTKLLAVCMILMAAENDNLIPNDPEYIKARCFLATMPDFGKLAEYGFIEFVDENGTVLANPYQSVPERSLETYREYRKEKDTPLPPSRIAFDQFNVMAKRAGLSVAQAFTKPRERAIDARLRECGGIDGWGAMLEIVEQTPYLCGENDRGWRADLDFVTKQSKFTKIMEGGYGRSSKSTGNRDGIRNGFIAVALGENSLEPDGGAIPG